MLYVKVRCSPYSNASVGAGADPGYKPSALRWHCHTSAVGGQSYPPNPRLPAQSDCYSFYHLPWEWKAESTLGPRADIEPASFCSSCRCVTTQPSPRPSITST